MGFHAFDHPYDRLGRRVAVLCPRTTTRVDFSLVNGNKYYRVSSSQKAHAGNIGSNVRKSKRDGNENVELELATAKGLTCIMKHFEPK